MVSDWINKSESPKATLEAENENQIGAENDPNGSSSSSTMLESFIGVLRVDAELVFESAAHLRCTDCLFYRQIR